MRRAAGRTTAVEQPRETARGVVAGMRLISGRRLRGCDDGRAVAGRLTVRRWSGELSPGDFLAPPGEAATARLRRDGRLLLLAGENRWGARTRRVAPYAAWLQGLPVLHAAAVEHGGEALALIGPSGVGKSTLAARLAGLGFAALYDDLTPLGETSARPCVGRSGQAELPLRALVFLCRRGRPQPARISLTPGAALRRLVRNGWGDLALPDLWRRQFDFHARLAARCPAFRLLLPDGRRHLARSASGAARLLAEI